VIWALPLEATLGLAAGVAVGWLIEAFVFGMQLISIQAGYAFASTIDPTTQADSGVLLIAGQLAAGLLFIAFGIEREVLAAFATSLDRAPPGSWQLQPGFSALAAQWTAAAITLALRLAFPVMALLLLLDLSLALLGRTQPQMQLVNLAFPVKMSATLVLLALQASMLPTALMQAARGLSELLGRFGLIG
jgi:flagellar biosynthesis protein FliR